MVGNSTCLQSPTLKYDESSKLADFVYRRFLVRLKAEREGFKPPVPVTAHLISNQAHSITLTPLRIN